MAPLPALRNIRFGLVLVLSACPSEPEGRDSATFGTFGGSDEVETDSSNTQTTLETGTSADTTSTDDTTSGGGQCGNGVIEGGEQCDTGDLGGATCESEGFGGGGLTCTADCTLDTSQCTQCGNGMIDGDEQCDGADLGASTTCADVNLGTAMEPLGCKDDCTYDFAMCSGCGDGVITEPEECEPAGELLDKDELGDATCMSQGFDDGLLSCSPGCTFNTDGCYNCGDAVQQGNEACDGADFADLTCADFLSPAMAPFDEGSLTCTGECTIDTANCSLCGDGVVSGAEVCEPGVLEGATCQSEGFDGGVLGCLADCSGYDTNACTDCGDGLIEGSEQCDFNNLGGASCQTLGFQGGGSLACTNGCLFNTSGCSNEFCGDGQKQANEQCDCGNQGVNCNAGQLGNQSCVSLGFSGGALQCNSPNNCLYDTSGCFSCGNGVIDPGEACDGANLGGQTCVSQGFPGGGTLSCSGCQFNTAQCVQVSNPYTVCVNPNTAIPVGAPAVTSGAGTPSIINVPSGGTITDVNVSINALHTWISDLQWTLSKGGTNRTLISNACGGVDNMQVTLDDEGVGAVQSSCNANPPAISGTRTPFQSLSIFDGGSMVGDWTLSVNDTVGGDTGTFQQWCITIAWQ